MAETDNGTLRAVFSGPNTFLLKVLSMHEGEEPLGAEFVEKSDAVICAMEERLTAGFSAEERRQLFSFFDRLRENLQS